MTLSDADQHKLAEIERRLEQDPAIARAFRSRRRMPWKLGLSALCAVLAYLVSVVTVALVTGSGLWLLVPVPAVAVTLAVLRWPALLWPPVPRRRHG